MIEWAKIIVSLLPVFIFLAALVFLDSYKLIRPASVFLTILVGSLAAVVCLFLNDWLLGLTGVEATAFSRYVAPVTEELLKAIFLVYLIRAKRVGFMVDAAICGFAIGAGFAFVENLYYLWVLESHNILLWIIRGFGTAALHGATTAIVGIISKSLTDRRDSDSLVYFIPGLVVAILTHSIFNHFIIPPVFTTIVLLTVLPMLLAFIFARSERITREWLGTGMDSDMELLDLITTDKITDSPVGIYLHTLKERFSGQVVADMLCFLRIHCELAMGAKAILLMREHGIKPVPNPDIKERFEELRYLEKSLGKTGKLAILPFVKTSRRDLWQLYMVGSA